MLEDLKILNGELELKFDKYNYDYTVLISDNIDSLEFSYKLFDNTFINIRNNELLDDGSIVYIDVFNSSEIETYSFYIHKDNVNTTSGIDIYKESLEIISNNEVAYYKIQLLSIGIFLAIVILFSILFKKKKIEKHY